MQLLENVMREAHMIRNMPGRGGVDGAGYMSTLTSGRESNNLLGASMLGGGIGREGPHHGSYNYLPAYNRGGHGRKDKRKVNWKEQAQDSRRLMQPKRQTQSNVNLIKK